MSQQPARARLIATENARGVLVAGDKNPCSAQASREACKPRGELARTSHANCQVELSPLRSQRLLWPMRRSNAREWASVVLFCFGWVITYIREKLVEGHSPACPLPFVWREFCALLPDS